MDPKRRSRWNSASRAVKGRKASSKCHQITISDFQPANVPISWLGHEGELKPDSIGSAIKQVQGRESQDRQTHLGSSYQSPRGCSANLAHVRTPPELTTATTTQMKAIIDHGIWEMRKLTLRAQSHRYLPARWVPYVFTQNHGRVRQISPEFYILSNALAQLGHIVDLTLILQHIYIYTHIYIQRERERERERERWR